MKKAFLYLSLSMITLISCNEKSTEKTITVTPQFRQDGVLWLLDAETSDTLQTLRIEIADDDFEVQTGLMYRPSMAQDQGMLFIFQNEDFHSFYMKNTLIPLDIIFVDAQYQIVNIHKNAQPMNEASLPSEKPVQYVLEVNGGMSDAWGLQPGDILSWQPQ
ncbi:MAG: DUF192 domain-containing protein [Bacteroidetes bacterium]|nr:DUF192 domain-containing protein [Bacteroidota bacterium]